MLNEQELQEQPLSLADYLLSHLAQECAEVVVRATKAQHFGLNEVEPGQEMTNRERLLYEVFDAMAMVEVLKDFGVLPHDFSGLLVAIEDKKAKAAHFRRYSVALNRLHSERKDQP
jgi:hypothetical protein